MGVRCRSIWLLCLFWLLSTGAWADEQGQFAISQVSFQPEVISSYLEILDQSAQAPPNLTVSSISAKLQGQPLRVIRLMPFAASGEGVAYLFLIDISESMTLSQFKQNQQLTKEWIDGLGPADRMALATFGADCHQVVDFTADKGTLESSLAALKPTDRQTELYLALKNAMDLSGRTEPGFPGRRVVVVLSDGLDEGSNVTQDEVLSLVRQRHVPVYAIGSSHLRPPYRQQGLDALKQIADSSGGLFRDATGSLTAAGKDLKDAIRRVYVASLACDGCQPSSQPNTLEITLTTGDAPRTSQIDLAVAAPPPVPQPQAAPWWKRLRVEVPLALLIIVLIALLIARARRKKPEPPGPISLKSEPEKSEPLRPKGLPLRFTTVAGKKPGQEYRLSLVERIVIGRDEGCDLAVPEDTEVSGRHCELTLAGRAVELTDLKSTNGTLLNGARVVARQRIESGDLIRVGQTELRVSFAEPE